MQRYFLNISNGNGFTRDEEGQELPDLASARAEAIKGIRSLIAGEVDGGAIDLAGRIDICDQDGTVLLSIPFVDAVRINLPGDTPE